ncbi:MAG: class I SAM-dependent RNA methyltransferase [Phycisphaerae bacterium]
MLEYQRTRRFFAQIPDEMEQPAAEELAELGAQDVNPEHRGIYFTADSATLYRINYCSRLISRVLAPLASFPCRSTDELYREARKIHWPKLFSLRQTFALFANVSGSKITHSKYAALRLKDAIVDQFRDKFQKRPSVDTESPHVWFSLYISRDQATISLDCSGGSLHRRGYREHWVPAPMQESLAAAIIRITGWDGERPLYDPMCGSGTLLTEAMMSYCRIPAGYLREDWGFRFLPDFEPGVWKRVKRESDEAIRQLPENLIGGSDINAGAVNASRVNCNHLPHGRNVDLQLRDFRDLEPVENRTIVCNPPYGIRMKDTREDPAELATQFGDFLKQKCTGSTAYVYFGDRRLVKRIGLRTSWKKPLRNGGLDGRLIKLELY